MKIAEAVTQVLLENKMIWPAGHERVTALIQELLATKDRCIAKVDMDEPIFVLRAQDKIAPDTIQYWGQRLMKAATEQGAEMIDTGFKFTQSKEDVEKFLNWQLNHQDRVKIPD